MWSFEAIGNRIELMMSNKQVFEYILSSVLHRSLSFMFGSLKDGDAVLKMEFADLSRNAKLLEINEFSTTYRYLCESWRGKEKAMIAEGNQYHDDLLTYLEKKVIEESDVDF